MAYVPPPDPFQSNYPRGPGGGMGYQRLPGVYFDAIGLAFKMIQANWGVYVVSTLLIFVVVGGLYMIPMFGVMTAIFAHPGAQVAPKMSWGMIGMIAVIGYIMYFCMLGLISVGVKQVRGQNIQLGDLFTPFGNFGPSALAALFAALPTILYNLCSQGLLMGMNPGNAGPFSPAATQYMIASGVIGLFGIVFQALTVGPLLLAGTHTVMTGEDPVRSVADTAKKLGANWFVFALLAAISYVIACLGGLCCGVGLLLTFPIATNVIALHYTYYYPQDPQPVAARVEG